MANDPQFSFDPFETPVDVIVLNGSPSPGIAKITGLSDTRKFDVQTSMYTSGGIVIFRGREPSRFTVTLTLATAQDWIDWASWRSVVARQPQGQFPRAMTIVHPWTAMLDVHEVVVESLGQPEEADETGSWTVAIKFLEFRPPKPSLAKPDAADTKKDASPLEIALANKVGEKAADEGRLAQLRAGLP